MVKLIDRIKSTSEPYIILIQGPFANRLPFNWPFAEGELGEVLFRRLRGERMGTKAEVMNEFAAALQFPEYFGHNWDALDECLSDLEWLPAAGYVLEIQRAGITLIADDGEFHNMLSLFDSIGREWSQPIEVGEYWDRPSRPFHVLLWEDQRGFGRLVQRAERTGVPFELWPTS